MRIAIVSFLFLESHAHNLKNFIATIEPLASFISVITGNIPVNKLGAQKIKVITIYHKKADLFISRTLQYIITQFKITYQLIRNLNDIDVLFFHIGGSSLVLPLLCSKLWKKKVAIIVTGSPALVAGVVRPSLPDQKMLTMLERINYRLADLIVALSGDLQQYPQLVPYKKKVCMEGARFVDISLFSIEKPLSQRSQTVAFIGRLSKEKGILEFVQSIQSLTAQENMDFLIIGDGPLREKISYQLAEEQKTGRVRLVSTVPHHEMATWLNEVRLLVIPSQTEGLPNILLEAMACGTPALTTSVGSIPALIKDEETGFILEDNLPETIITGVLRALNHTKTEYIARNARQLIEAEYTYDAAVERYRNILSILTMK